jgi:hypothetical protein
VEVVIRFRVWLEDESRAIREGLRDAEAWYAKLELDAALTDEVEAAGELVALWRRSWESHCELCDWFAGYAQRVLDGELSRATLLKGQTA